jgi:CheY-like chemotaxis protein
MNEFSLLALCRELIGELAKKIGDKNDIKLSVDIQLPEKFTGVPGPLIETMRSIALYVSKHLVNGSISIEVFKREARDGQIVAAVHVTGAGTVVGEMSKEEMTTRFKGFPYTINRKIQKSLMTFDFNVDLSVDLNPVGPTQKKSNLRFDKKRILVAEDTEINAMLFTGFLEEWGCDVTIAVNGSEAIAKAQETFYDAILMDIYMPIVNGIKATSKIRKFNTFIPIIVLTASTEEHDVREVIKAGANDYLRKPISSNNLLKVLSKYL